MTFSILRLLPGQKIARPFNRACSVQEMAEMLVHHRAYEANELHGRMRAMREANARAREAIETPEAFVKATNIDTELPVFEIGPVKFFTFRED